MPCRSDYMEQNNSERRFQQTAQYLIYAMQELGQKVPVKYQNADTYYSQNVGQVEALCALIRAMTDEERERIIYDAHNATARKLAAWWDEHVEEDNKRERAELVEAVRVKLAEQARNKLSDEERKALGV